MVDSSDKVKAFENFTLDGASAAEEKPAAKEEKPAAPAGDKPKPKKAAGGGKSNEFFWLKILNFSKGWPTHQKVAMPALSPTMKNVRFFIKGHFDILFERGKSPLGVKRKVTSCLQEMFFVRLRLIRHQSVLKSKRKDT